MLLFDRFDASTCDFPPPAVPLLPALRWGDIRPATVGQDTAAALRRARHFSRGRYALHEAFKLAGLGVETTLLAPSYHCRTMIDPAIALGANVDFYPLDETLAPSFDVIEGLIRTAVMPVKALILPHYFGFSQDCALLEALTALCASRQIVLVEDCSHSWQLAMRSCVRIKSQWHMAVASPYKFFATPDGGTLWCCRESTCLSPRLRPGLFAEFKELINIVRNRQRRTSTETAHGSSSPMGIVHVERTPVLSAHYLPSEEHGGGLSISRYIMRHTDIERATRRRRENFQTLLDATAGLPYLRPLFDFLPAESAPYMFPLYIERGAADFHALKSRGMPIWRWDDMARSDCRVADDYRLHLLHLPCHQDLSTAQLEWMCVQLAQISAPEVSEQ